MLVLVNNKKSYAHAPSSYDANSWVGKQEMCTGRLLKDRKGLELGISANPLLVSVHSANGWPTDSSKGQRKEAIKRWDVHENEG